MGVTTQGSIALPSPVSSSLTVTLTIEPNNAGTITPSVTTLLPGASSVAFSFVGNAIGPLYVHAALSGPDSAFFGQVGDYEVAVSPSMFCNQSNCDNELFTLSH